MSLKLVCRRRHICGCRTAFDVVAWGSVPIYRCPAHLEQAELAHSLAALTEANGPLPLSIPVFGVCDTHAGTNVPHEYDHCLCVNWRSVDWPVPPALNKPENR